VDIDSQPTPLARHRAPNVDGDANIEDERCIGRGGTRETRIRALPWFARILCPLTLSSGLCCFLRTTGRVIVREVTTR
jgi:hypothetical protein